MEPSLAQDALGPAAAVYDRLLEPIIASLRPTAYQFLPESEYTRVIKESPSDGMRIYWEEMLYRAHWAATSSIIRLWKWHTACLWLFAPSPNFLGFSAALRGFLEASVDSHYSLAPAALTIAVNNSTIRNALAGTCAKFVVCKDLEDLLIHFQFARKLAKQEQAPESHKAMPVDKYIQHLDDKTRPLVHDLYSELCQFVHPAAHSVLWMTTSTGQCVTMQTRDDKDSIMNLTSRHTNAIEQLYMVGINPCLLVLKTLNLLSVNGLISDSLEKVDLSNLPMWTKISNEFQTN